MRRVWVPVSGDPRYEITRSGAVRNAVTKRVLAASKAGLGYLCVSLGANNKRYVHHLVLETFVGPRPEGTHASHKNGSMTDNRASNLAWETPKQNNARKVKHGTALFGDRNPMGRKTHCKRGHEFTQENTRLTNGRRICRACCREDRFQSLVEARQITPEQERAILSAINGDAALTMARISERLGFRLGHDERSNGNKLSRIVRDLEERGYVMRTRDQRPVPRTITDLGRKRLKKLQAG